MSNLKIQGLKGIFRAEVVQSVATKRYGSILLVQPASHAFLAWLFFAIATAIITLFGVLQYQRKVQVAGVLLPDSGLIKVASTQTGTITQRLVADGQVVRAGDVLFVVNGERESVAVGRTSRLTSMLLQERKNNLSADRVQIGLQIQQKVTATRKKEVDLESELGKLDAQIALQKQRVEITEESYAQYVDLQKQNFVSAAQLRAKQAELLDQRQRLTDFERAKAATARDIEDIRAAIGDLTLQVTRDQAAVARGITAIDQDIAENEARRESVIRAPVDGVITSIATEPGQLVSAGTSLAIILPKGASLQADLLVPTRAVGFIKPGSRVLIRYQAFPYQKFGQQQGVIRDISDATLLSANLVAHGQESGANTGVGGEPMYRVRVDLPVQYVSAYGARQPLKAGMVVEASLLTESRKLYEWVLEPLYSVSGRI